MNEVLEGRCFTHQGAETLRRIIMLLGYYWPSMGLDC